MKWFYFVDSKGERHYANTRKEAEFKREQIGGGSVIYETNIYPGHRPESSLQQSSGVASNARNSGSAVSRPLGNDTSWLRRTTELVHGQNKQIPALQIYHPTRSSLHSESDKRLLRLKDASLSAIAHYAAALKLVLPLDKSVLLCCAPGSSPDSASGLAEIIRRISGGALIDGTSVLCTQTARQRKSNGARFEDHELASTISIKALPLPPDTRILLIDDVVTSGQTLRVCTSLLYSAYPSFSITCLAISSTDYDSTAVGIAEKVEVTSQFEALKPLHAHGSHRSLAANETTTDTRRANNHASSQVSQSSLARNVAPSNGAPGSSAYRKQSASSSSSDCFVVTAIYEGERDHPNVIRLRRFRDQRIAALPCGNAIIYCYNLVGPTLARFVRKARLSRPMRITLNYFLEKAS
ncbi:MAG: hypothetical protein EBZ48_06340 [Proteobacteria bacterium]|nr:hypothetical protein [Pseudomonadota bacterium]